MHQRIRKTVAPVALIAGLGVAATALDAMKDPVPHLDAQASQETLDTPESLATAFRSASKRALAGVVHVEVESAPRAVSRQVPGPFQGTPFEDFFRMQPGPQGPRQGSGSGFIISSEGYILTNKHVVDNASRVTVTLTDKREFEAEVVGTDPNTDVAVLKINGEDLPSVDLGNSNALQIGDWVLALGYPLSLGETVTAGIVSAKGKNINILRRNEDANAPLEHFIQTDAAINPGNSGGPLVNLRGEVIGINTAIASPTGTYTGYGFAVPIHLAKRVADDLIRYGAVHRPKLGVQIKDVEPADVDVFGLKGAQGAVVATVPEGPAKEAGIRIGDVIVGVEGSSIKDTGELMEKIALRQPGEKVTLDVVRYGDRTRVTVELGQFETANETRTARRSSDRDAVGRLGFAAAEMTPAMARELGVEDSGGVVITRVDPMGPAPRALTGLRLDRVNGKEIESIDDLREVAEDLEAGSTVSIIGRMPDGNQTILNYRLRG